MVGNYKRVSVIVTTRNEEVHIGNCLESVKSQTYPEEYIEIIVVDNNSQDSTKEIAKDFTAKVYNWGPERSAQRNFGVSKACGDYILYLDTDMILSGNVIAECVLKCENEGLIALYIPERIKGAGFWIKVRDFERSFYDATCIDCARFIRRDKFLEIGGFDESLTGPEDWDFDRRLRQIGKAAIINTAIDHNEGGFSLKKYINKKTYYMQWFDKYVRKWGRNDPIIRKQLGFWYRYFGVFIENNKWKKLLRHPLLALGTYLLKLTVGLYYLKYKCPILKKVS